jgi:hypothetical protein
VRTGTDIHDLQERIGSDIYLAEILNARKTIDESQQKGIVDMVKDESLSLAERKRLE